jgi:hypothetical protein
MNDTDTFASQHVREHNVDIADYQMFRQLYHAINEKPIIAELPAVYNHPTRMFIRIRDVSVSISCVGGKIYITNWSVFKAELDSGDICWERMNDALVICDNVGNAAGTLERIVNVYIAQYEMMLEYMNGM